MKTTNIMIVGVGGQGSLLASKLLGSLLLDEGYDVKVSEVHGMSQRGGSVVTYVKFGEKVYSPIITDGEADYILSFEKIEAARYAECLKKTGKIITNDRETDPMPVITGAVKYPEALDEKISANANLTAVDALALAKQAGNIKSVNVVLIGVLAKNSNIEYEKWIQSIKETVPEKFLEANLKAFDLGYNL